MPMRDVFYQYPNHKSRNQIATKYLRAMIFINIYFKLKKVTDTADAAANSSELCLSCP